MSHAKQLHHRRYLNDDLEMINRRGLPGNVKNAVCQNFDKTLTYLKVDVPDALWSMMRTTNLLECFHREATRKQHDIGMFQEVLWYLVADAPRLGPGTFLYAVEGQYYNGPWDNAEALQKFNGFLKYTVANRHTGFSLLLMGYHNTWDSTDQIPLLSGFAG